MNNIFIGIGIFSVVIILVGFVLFLIDSIKYNFYQKKILEILETKKEGLDYCQLQRDILNPTSILSGFYKQVFSRVLVDLVKFRQIQLDDEGLYKKFSNYRITSDGEKAD